MDMSSLLEDICNPNYFCSQKAAWELVKLGPEATSGLLRILDEAQSSATRYRAAWALGKIKDQRAVEPLGRALLQDPDTVVREWCAAALENLGHVSAVPYLSQAMSEDKCQDVQLRATAALRGLRASSALRDYLTHIEPRVREMAITALARLKDETAMEAAYTLLQDPDPGVRRSAARYMGMVGLAEAIDSLAPALSDPSSRVREEGIRALRDIGGDLISHLLIPLLQDEDPSVRLTAITCLGELGDKASFQSLVDVMFGQDHPEIRAWAAWSLGELNDPRAVEPLKAACLHCPPEVKRKAKDSLNEVYGIKLVHGSLEDNL